MMNDLADRLVIALLGLAGETGYTGAFRALLGRGDGSGIILNEGGLYKREVWIHRPGQPPMIAILGANCGITYDNLSGLEGTIQVLVAYPFGEVIPEVIKITQTGMEAVGDRSPAEQLLLKALTPEVSRLDNLRVESTAPPSTSVKIRGCTYTQPSTGDLKVFPDTTYPLDALIAALGTDEQQVAWICLDYETGAIFAPAITATTSGGTLPTRGEFSPLDIGGIAVTSTYKRSVPVYLYENQTEIVEADFYRNLDARLDYPLPTSAFALNRIQADANGQVQVDANGNVIYV